MRWFAVPSVALLCLCTTSHAQRPLALARAATAVDTAGAATAAERWWHALTFGDTAHLARHSDARLTVTFSNGQRFDRASLLRRAAGHHPKPTAFLRRTGAAVIPTGGTVAVTLDVLEGTDTGANAYHYLSVLEKHDADWRVVAAQSTRELGLTPRVSAQVAGPLSDYIGRYRGGRGGVLRIVARDSVLALIDPGGTEVRIEPIGPGLFELPLLYDGIALVRFAFARDSTGRVSSLTRMIYGSVDIWPRVP